MCCNISVYDNVICKNGQTSNFLINDKWKHLNINL